MRRSDPGCDRVPRLLSDLKLDRPLGLLLHHNRARGDSISVDHIADAEANQIAAAQLAVNCEIEQCELSGSPGHLQSNSDGPDLFQLQRGLLAEQPALVPRWYTLLCR